MSHDHFFISSQTFECEGGVYEPENLTLHLSSAMGDLRAPTSVTRLGDLLDFGELF